MVAVSAIDLSRFGLIGDLMNWFSKSVATLLAAVLLNLPLVHATTISCSGDLVISPSCSCCVGESACCVAPKAFPEDQAPQILSSGLTLAYSLEESPDVVPVFFLSQSRWSSHRVDPVRGPPGFLKHIQLLI